MATTQEIEKALKEKKRRKQEEAISREQFVAKWVSLSEEKRARLVFQALVNKADRDHYHSPERY